MLQKVLLTSFAFGHGYGGGVMSKCYHIWTLKQQCHIEGVMRCVNSGWSRDVTDSQGMKHTAHHWGRHTFFVTGGWCLRHSIQIHIELYG